MEQYRERAAWLAKFVMPYEPELRQWLARHPIPELEIDDIIQETYATLAGLPSTDEIFNPRSYAFQTAYSIVLAYRRRSRIVSITPVADLEILAPVSDQPSPETAACDREELLAVVEAMSELPERIREIFVLRRINGLSQRDVAQNLGITENVVEKAVARGLRALLNGFKRGGKVIADTPSKQEFRHAPSQVQRKDSLKAR